jgi:hypothetical protein
VTRMIAAPPSASANRSSGSNTPVDR